MGDIDDSMFHQKLRVGQALSHLAEGRYLESAKIFTSIDIQLTNQFNSVISAEDLAVYGSILGLATMNRDMLHGLVIDGAFKARLEVSYRLWVVSFSSTLPTYILTTFLFNPHFKNVSACTCHA